MSTSANKRKIKIGLIGVGMVGEPIKRWFEEYQGYKRGRDLFCYDADPKKNFSDDINKADIVFVAVPTPTNPDGSCDISIVENAVSKIADGKTVIIKSTVTPGTVEGLQKQHPRKKFIFNPEFLTEAQAWLDYLKPDRQIVGHTVQSYGDVKKISALLPKADFKYFRNANNGRKGINATEAELAKYASNVFGYIKVVYGNILADICHALTVSFNKNKIDAAVDYENVREAVAADRRIGPAWLDVEHGNYCGAGGYCFPKDMKALVKFSEKLVNDIAARKRKTDAGLIASLKKGIEVLRAVEDYNKTLLAWQGLTIEEVSRHNQEMVTNKRKPIRIYSKA